MESPKKNATNYATLTLPNGESVQLPILEGTAGPNMIDVRFLYQLTGMFTFDPGFTCTGSCESKITFIDGGITEYVDYFLFCDK